MENRNVSNSFTPESRGKGGREHLACSLWIRVVFIGGSALVAGVIQLFDGTLTPLAALTLAVGGGAVTTLSLWRANAILDHIGRTEAMTADRPAPADASVMTSA